MLWMQRAKKPYRHASPSLHLNSGVYISTYMTANMTEAYCTVRERDLGMHHVTVAFS